VFDDDDSDETKLSGKTDFSGHQPESENLDFELNCCRLSFNSLVGQLATTSLHSIVTVILFDFALSMQLLF
jgi:hypothetical protein